MEWSKWLDVREKCDYVESAVYQMRIRKGDGSAFVVNRMLAPDPEGLVSIGKTTGMERRRAQFVSGMNKCYGHSEGNLLYILLNHSLLKKVMGEPLIQYRYHRVESDAEARAAEDRLLKKYLIRYGELPPLNAAIPDRYNIEAWCACAE